MPIPEFVVEIRKMIGHHPMWLPGVTAVVVARTTTSCWSSGPTTARGRRSPGSSSRARSRRVAAAREALEETGVVVSVDRLASTSADPGVVHANGDQASYLDLTFACTYVSGEAHVADDESVDVRWFPATRMPEMASPSWIRSAIDDALSGRARRRGSCAYRVRSTATRCRLETHRVVARGSTARLEPFDGDARVVAVGHQHRVDATSAVEQVVVRVPVRTSRPPPRVDRRRAHRRVRTAEERLVDAGRRPASSWPRVTWTCSMPVTGIARLWTAVVDADATPCRRSTVAEGVAEHVRAALPGRTGMK